MKLRPYQQAAVDAAVAAIRDGTRNPVITLPTGSGKSLVIADLARRMAAKGGRVLVITHRQELLKQNRAELVAVAPELEWESGFFCAGLNEKNLSRPVTFASVASLANQPPGPDMLFHAVLLDECHRVPGKPPKKSKHVPLYERVWKALRESRPDGKLPYVIGLSATPFRHLEGYVWEMDGGIFDGECHHTDMLDLVEQGFLAPLVPVKADHQIDLAQLKTNAGDFTARSQEEAMHDALLDGIAAGALAHADEDGRRGIMVFTPTKNTTRRIAGALRERGCPTVHVLDELDSREREQALAAYVSRQARAVVSCGILTEGFNARHTDLIVMARATQSHALWGQVAGRGSRMCEGKTDCLIRDHGEHVSRLGPINALRPRKAEKRPGAGERKPGDPLVVSSGQMEKAQLKKLSLNPSRKAMMLGTLNGQEPDWRRVIGSQARLMQSSRSGKDMYTVVLDLEGAPGRVYMNLVLGKGTYAAATFKRLTGRNWTRNPDLDLPQLRYAAKALRRVTLKVENGWTNVDDIEQTRAA